MTTGNNICPEVIKLSYRDGNIMMEEMPDLFIEFAEQQRQLKICRGG